VHPKEELLGEAEKLAATIAGYSKPITAMAKECVNVAFNSTLDQGLLFERRSDNPLRCSTRSSAA
jgi:enoyl-CoA hydratase